MSNEDIKVDLYMGTATFFVNVESAATKTTYRGKFKVKCLLNAFDYIKSDGYFRDLLGKTNPDYANEYVTKLCYIFSQLKYRVMESPAWFTDEESQVMGNGLEDNVLMFIFDKCVDAEEMYRSQIEEKYEQSKGEVKKAIDDGELGGNDGSKPQDEALGEGEE